MSTILKALEKLESERSGTGADRGAERPDPEGASGEERSAAVLQTALGGAGVEPPADAGPGEPALALPGEPFDPGVARRRGAVWAAGAAAVALVLGLLWIWVLRSEEPAEPLAAALRAGQDESPASGVTSRRVAETRPRTDGQPFTPASRPGELPRASAKPGLRPRATKPVDPAATTAVQPAASPGTPGPAGTLPAATRVVAARSASSASRVAAEPPPAHRESRAPNPAHSVASRAPAARSAQKTRGAGPVPTEAPEVAVVPRPPPKPRIRPALPPPPAVAVERTIWHPDASRRRARVRVEGRREAVELREGDVIGVLVVAEIHPSSVVFLHGSERLTQPVGR